ncbi:MAG: CHAT domain-containing protein [Bacteroidetes bacterium]|nr:CHAT domain-containing protein [Bacteroidota bacterium]
MKTLLLFLIPLFVTAQGQQERLLQQGLKASSKGLYDSAEFYYRNASSYYTSQNDRKNFLNVSIYRADNLANWGNYDAAIQIAKMVEEESEQWLGPRNYFQGFAYQAIGNAELKKGNYQQAIDQFWDAELIFIGNETSKPWLAGLYNATGNAMRDNGSYSQAIDYFNRAHNQFQRQGDEINATIAQLNIAGCYVMQEKYDEAVKEFEQGKSFFLEHLGEKHPLFGSLYNNIGAAVFYQAKDYSLALQYYLKSLAIRQKQTGEIHLDVARVYFNVGWTYEMMKKFTESDAYYSKAENILNQIFKNGHPLAAWAYSRHGHLMSRQKKFQEALGMYDLAETQNVRQVRGEKIFLDKVRAIETYKFRATTYYDWYKATKNPAHLKNALKFLIESEKVMGQAGKQRQKEGDRLEIGKISRNIFEMGVEVCYELNRITKDQVYLEEFFYFSESGKAQVLNQAVEESQALKFAGIPDSLIAEDRDNRKLTAEYTQKLLSFDPARQPASDLKDIEDILFFTSASAKMLEQQLEQEYPKYFQLKYQEKNISLKELQQQIPPGEMVMSYIITDSLVFASAITAKDIEVKPVAIKPSQLERMITAMRSGILFQQKEAFTKSSHQLFTLLFPSGIPSDIKSIVIIPDKRLAKIPFETLLETTTPPDADYARMNFIINRVTVSYANSARLYLSRIKFEPSKSVKGLLAVAPVFDDDKTNGINLRTRSWLTATEKVIKNSGQTRGQLFNGNAIAPLPATADEINSLYRLFERNKSASEMILGKLANERKLKNTNLSDFKFIHIATHGFANEESPELSGLLLAQDTTELEEDNVLYMGEIYNMQLKCELVTLSACETGLGKIMEGEGVVGLARALTYAGAQNILVSLWKVNDASTAALMIDFYQALLNESRDSISAALQKAKTNMIASGKYADPYYWSPFVLLGR